MRKVQFGCGGNRLSGWENYDSDVDVTKPLPMENNSVDRVFAEHLLEHLDSGEAFRFLEECYRILKPGGGIRIVVPSFNNVLESSEKYMEYTHAKGFATTPDKIGVCRAIACCHGHKTLWNYDLIGDVLESIFGNTNTGLLPEFENIDGHWRECGREIADEESISVEAIK